MKTLIIHHNDLDGVASAAIASMYEKSKGREVEYMMVSYADRSFDFRGFDRVYVLDFSFGRETRKVLTEAGKEGIVPVWIDHHKTAFEKDEEFELFGDGTPFLGEEDMIPGIRRVGTAACELTWEFFFPDKNTPMLIQYLGTYDVWNKDRFNWDNVMHIQYGARAAFGLDVDKVVDFLENNGCLECLMRNGIMVLNFIKLKNEGECKTFAFEAMVEGYRAICMNTTEFNSQTFESVYNESKHDLMMPFCYQESEWRCSLYTTKDIDVSEIAKGFGGGGHKQAAGFQLPTEKMMKLFTNKVLNHD